MLHSGTPSLTSLPQERRSELFWSFIWKVAHPISVPTQSCLTAVKQMELTGPLGHSPRCMTVHMSCIENKVKLGFSILQMHLANTEL